MRNSVGQSFFAEGVGLSRFHYYSMSLFYAFTDAYGSERGPSWTKMFRSGRSEMHVSPLAVF